MKKILLYVVLMGVGFVAAPLAVALVMDNTRTEKRVGKDPEKMSMDELLKAEREAISTHESNVGVMAISSVVGLIGGALVAAALSRRRSFIVY